MEFDARAIQSELSTDCQSIIGVGVTFVYINRVEMIISVCSAKDLKMVQVTQRIQMKGGGNS